MPLTAEQWVVLVLSGIGIFSIIMLIGWTIDVLVGPESEGDSCDDSPAR